MATLVTVLFVVSGMVALAYEVVWVRALGLVVGNSLWATTAVVAAYMGGMAIGNAAVARWAPRIRRHLRLYAAAEAVAALVALATVPALHLLGGVAARLGPEPLAGWGVPLAGRFALAWLFLALPTIAMGATLPLLVERVGHDEALGRRVARLYAANTLGAVAGVLVTAFVALPALGEKATLAAAATLGLLVTAVAWPAERWLPPARPAAAPAAAAGRTAARHWLLFPALFGFVALAAELVWTRILLLHLGSRVYAFAVILAVYLAGIALGASLARRLPGRPGTALAACQVVLAVAIAAQVPAFAVLGEVLGWLAAVLHPVGFAGLWLTLGVGVALPLLVPTLAFGASFPLAVAVYPREATAAVRTGAVGAANTLGGIVGAVAGPLVLVPLVGSQNALLLLALATAGSGALLAPGPRLRLAAGAAAAIVAMTAVLAPRGMVLRGAAVVSDGTVISLSESASATVAVKRVTDARGSWDSLELNGVNVAGTSPELRAIQRLQGHLPLLLHPHPEKVLHIGFGSGGTAWAVARHPVRDIVVAEISPEVLATSTAVFGEVNHNVLADPRVRVVLNDGRNVLLASPEQFDVILSDSIHPVYAGNSTLYTREYFASCRAHLRPGGVVSMWLPMYSLSEDSYLGIMRAFVEVFPNACIWYDPIVLNEFTVVTGSTAQGPVRLRWEALAEPALAETLAEAGVRLPRDLAEMLLLGPAEVAFITREVLPHVDDFPEVEYRSGRVLDRDGSWLANLRLLYAFRARPSPFAGYPGDWGAAAASRDAKLADQIRTLGRRVAAR